ncbi:alpha/beta hydrolase [Nocardiopsis protaetiae]|uniref:alpha/beta hydrolase n=3 Tax=Nocardiopsidaceae TaxID=83676 RepID=UPI00387A9C36
MRDATRLLAVTLALLLTTGCAILPFVPTPTEVAEALTGDRTGNASGVADRFTDQRILWYPCYSREEAREGHQWGADPSWLRELECGTLLVPLDHSDPQGRSLRLAVMRAPADGPPEERIGSLVINPGGPGGYGIETLYYRPFSDEIRVSFDLVSFDPRGVGASHGLACGDWEALYAEIDAAVAVGADDLTEDGLAALDGRARAYAQDCVDEAGEEFLAAMGTVNVVRDLELLRRALGDDALTYVGYSYGTHIGALYAHLYPETSRALVLDGGVETDHTNAEAAYEQAVGFQESWEHFAEYCVSSADMCPFDTADGAGPLMEDVLDGLDEDPYEIDGWRIDAAAFMDLVSASLYDEYNWDILDDVLYALDTGEGGQNRLQWFYDTVYYTYTEDEEEQAYFDQESLATMTAVNCADRADPVDLGTYLETARREARDAPLFAGNVWLQLPCAYWPETEEAPTGFTAPDAPPLVVVGTVADPATPYAWSRELTDQLETATLVTYEGGGHTIYGYGVNRCVDDVVDTYLLALTPPGSGHTCRPE